MTHDLINQIRASNPDPTKMRAVIAALRDPPVEQTRWALRDENGCMCVLGLITLTLDPSKLDGLKKAMRYNDIVNPMLGATDFPTGDLVVANDVEGWTFEKFADVFEQAIAS